MFHFAEHDWNLSKMKKLKVKFCSSSRAHVLITLGEAILWVAHFDSPPVAGTYQTDEAQQIGKCPGHVGGIVTSGEVPSANL